MWVSREDPPITHTHDGALGSLSVVPNLDSIAEWKGVRVSVWCGCKRVATKVLALW